MVNNFVKSLTQKLPDCFKNDRMSPNNQKILRNQKIRDVMEICQQKNIKPTAENCSSTFKRYKLGLNAKLSAASSTNNSPR
jgi:hypothetical protein